MFQTILFISYCIATISISNTQHGYAQIEEMTTLIGNIVSEQISNIATDQSILGEGESINTENPCCDEACIDEKKAEFDDCPSACYTQTAFLESECDLAGSGSVTNWESGFCPGLLAASCYGVGDPAAALPIGHGVGSAGGKYVLGPYYFDFYEAQHFCKYRHGTELASIHNFYDFTYTVYLCALAHAYYESVGIDPPITQFDGCWIGLYQLGQAGASISGPDDDCQGPSEPDTPSSSGCSKGWYFMDGSKPEIELTGVPYMVEDKGTKLGTWVAPVANDFGESQNCMALQWLIDAPTTGPTVAPTTAPNTAPIPVTSIVGFNDWSCTDGETIFPSRGDGWKPQYAICNGPKYYKKPPKPAKDLAAARTAVYSHDMSMESSLGLKSNEPQTVTFQIDVSQSTLITLLIMIITGGAVCMYYNFRGKLKTITSELMPNETV